jgi:hypothetical protein
MKNPDLYLATSAVDENLGESAAALGRAAAEGTLTPEQSAEAERIRRGIERAAAEGPGESAGSGAELAFLKRDLVRLNNEVNGGPT